MSKHAIESDSSDDDDDEEDQNTGDEKQGQGASDCDEEQSEDDEEDLVEEQEGDNQQQEEGDEEEEQKIQDTEAEEIEEDIISTNNDPFVAHFEVYVDQSLISSVNTKNNWRDTSVKMPILGNLQVTTLDVMRMRVLSRASLTRMRTILV